MPQITITNIDTKSILPYNKIISEISKKVSVQNVFNSYLLFEENSLYLVKRDSLVSMSLRIPSTIDKDSESFGFKIDSDMLFTILTSYKEADLASLQLIIISESPACTIKTHQDNIDIPCGAITESEKKDLLDVIHFTYLKQDGDLSLADFPDRIDTLIGIFKCASFLGKDDKNNNAVSFDNKKILVKDGRAIIYSYFFKTELAIPLEKPILIHKKSIEILQSLFSIKSPFEFSLTEENKRVVFHAPDLKLILNNSVASISLPSEENLLGINSTNKITQLTANQIYETSTFFSSFFDSTSHWQPIILSVKNKSLTVSVLNSKANDVRSCNVVRDIEAPILSAAESVTISNTYLLSFINLVKDKKQEVPVEIFWDNRKKSVVLKSFNQIAYLATLRDK